MIDARLLAGTSLFSTLGDEQRSELAQTMTAEELRAGKTVFSEGDPGDAFFIVETGEVKIFTTSPDGEEVILNTMGPGDFFGELALLDGKERSAGAQATTETRMFKLDRTDFLAVVRCHPAISEAILIVLCDRLRRNAVALGDAMTAVKRSSTWKVTGTESVCPHLPVLDLLQDELGQLDEGISGFVGLQHLMGSTATLIDKLVADRLDPGDVFVLGKPYSTNRQVMDYLKNTRRYHVHPECADQPVDEPHNDVLYRRIDDLMSTHRRRIEESVSGNTGRVVLVDDGGHAIRRLHSPPFSGIVDRFVCVEQTRSGIRTIEDLDLRVPVINVAECWVKLEHESPLIAESVKIELFKLLVAIESGGIRIGRNVLVIGYGSIGRTVAARMHGCGFTVTVFDRSKILRDLATQDGFDWNPDLQAAMKDAELIVGCTGTMAVDIDDYGSIPEGAILISTSSSDVEFCGWKLRSSAEPLGIPRYWSTIQSEAGKKPSSSIEAEHPCFSLYRVKLDGSSFYLVNGGFPVNFTGTIDPIPPRLIQLTRGLLYAGAVQASRETRPGLHALSERAQELVMKGYEQWAQGSE